LQKHIIMAKLSFQEKHEIALRLANSKHVTRDIALLKTKDPSHRFVRFAPPSSTLSYEVLIALLTFCTEAEIVSNRGGKRNAPADNTKKKNSQKGAVIRAIDNLRPKIWKGHPQKSKKK